MKTLKGYLAHLKRNPIFYDIFSNADDVFGQFQIPVNKDYKICYAYYSYEDYSGSAVVFFYDKATKKYFEVYGSHCSCFGLENQWQPSEVSVKELENRLKQGYLFDDGYFKDGFSEWLKG